MLGLARQNSNAEDTQSGAMTTMTRPEKIG
jgi:hypothetical protein